MSIKYLLLAAALLAGYSLPALSEPPSPVIPETKIQQEWWKNRYEGQAKALKEQTCDILFLGDSITDFWESRGKKVWDSTWAPLHACNFGVSADRTSNLLWRIDDSKLASQTAPKVCIIMIGTNNTGQYKCEEAPEKTAIGILTVTQRLLLRYPDTQVLVLAIFPRGATPQDPMRIHNEKINKVLANTRLPRTTFVNINQHFLDKDGNLLPDIANDLLHPTEKGYRIWAEALLPAVKSILNKN